MRPVFFEDSDILRPTFVLNIDHLAQLVDLPGDYHTRRFELANFRISKLEVSSHLTDDAFISTALDPGEDLIEIFASDRFEGVNS